MLEINFLLNKWIVFIFTLWFFFLRQMTSASANGPNVNSVQNPIAMSFAEYTQCPQHRAVLLSLCGIIQVRTLKVLLLRLQFFFAEKIYNRKLYFLYQPTYVPIHLEWKLKGNKNVKRGLKTIFLCWMNFSGI